MKIGLKNREFEKSEVKLQCSTEGKEMTFGSVKLSGGTKIRGPGIEKSRDQKNSARNGQTN